MGVGDEPGHGDGGAKPDGRGKASMVAEELPSPQQAGAKRDAGRAQTAQRVEQHVHALARIVA